MHKLKGMVIAAIAFFFVSVFQVQGFSDGYILTGCYGGTSTYLIDKNGQIVQQWIHKQLTDSLNGYSAYLLENGNLLRTAQVSASTRIPKSAAPLQGIIDEIDRMGNVVWTYTLANDTFMMHHDIKPLPPRPGETVGNILASCFAFESKAEMRRVGVDTTLLPRRDTTGILAEKIIEIKRKYPSGGDIVWQWRMFDHVEPKATAADHPEKISGGIVPALWSGQWVHLNGLDYSPKNDLIVFSSRVFSELFVIDHSTTTAQAAGSTGGKYNKGGDILYRWGKPGNYGATGLTVDCLHSTTWIPEGCKGAGNILFYHNNINAQKSEVIEICPPVDGNGNFIMQTGTACGPATPTWKYTPTDTTDKFFSQFMSSTMRMNANGNTIIHEAYPPDTGVALPGGAPKTDSRIREVTYDGQIVDSIRLKIKENPGTGMGMTMAFNPAKIMYYPSTYKGIAVLFLQKTGRDNQSRTRTPGPLFTIRQKAGSIFISGVSGCEITMVDLHGKTVLSAKSKTNTFSLRAGSVPAGVCCVTVTKGDKQVSSAIINVSR